MEAVEDSQGLSEKAMIKLRLTTHCEMCPVRLWFWQGYLLTSREVLALFGVVDVKRYVVCSDFCADLLRRHIHLGVR